MDAAHEKARATRLENEVKRYEAARRASEELAEAVRGLNLILTDPEASREERLKAAELIVELKKNR